MSRLTTVEELIAGVRSLLDEKNSGAVENEADLLPSLNRALYYAFDILVRKYPEPLIKEADFPLVGGQKDYAVPENLFEDRVEKMDIYNNGFTYPLTRLSYRDATPYNSPMTVAIPRYYVLFERKIRLIPTPTGTYSAKMWYAAEPDKLVLTQGRITSFNVANNSIVLDDVGSKLSTTDDTLNNYLNIVDGQTGIIKASMQINSIVGNKIVLRTIPSQSSVVNRTISGSLPSDISNNDYVCEIAGTCVPLFAYPMYNFLVEYCVAEMKRKLGADSNMEEKLKQEFEKQIEHSWVERESSKRVKRKSRSWQRGRLYRKPLS